MKVFCILLLGVIEPDVLTRAVPVLCANFAMLEGRVFGRPINSVPGHRREKVVKSV